MKSAGKRKTGKTHKGDPSLRKALTEAAKAAARSKDIYLATEYHRLRGREGRAKAAGAVRHAILAVAWQILSRPRRLRRTRRGVLRPTPRS